MRKLLGVILLALAMLAPVAPASFAQNSQLLAFVPQGNATLAVSGASARVALPTTSAQGSYNAIISNTGTNDVYIALGDVTVSSTTSSFLVPAGQWRGIAIGSQTYIAGITATSTSSLTIATGKGTPIGGSSGSSGGGGGGGPVTQATTPWLVAGQGTAGVPGTAALTIQGIGSGTPVPVSNSSLPLPTGAATAAKQPALGTAGSPSTDVISVQGVASGTVLPISAASLPLPTGASTSAKQPALGTAGTPSTDVISVQGVASGTVLPFNQTQVNGVAVSTGTGAQGTGSQRVAVATDTATIAGSAPGTAGSASANVLSIQGIASMTPIQGNQVQINGVTVSVGNGTTDTGTQRVTISSDSTGGIALKAGTQNIGAVVPAASALANGATTTNFVAANSNNSTSLKGSAGQVYHISAYGISTTTPAFIKLFNKATAPTCGTDTPVWVGMIPAPAAGGSGLVDDISVGITFATGIGYCVVTGIAASDNTSVAAATYVVNIGYK